MDTLCGIAPSYPGLTLVLSVEAPGWACGEDDDPVRHAEMAGFLGETLAATAAAVTLPTSLVSEVSVTLADDESVREANAAWRGKDAATNILSFPLTDLQPGDEPGALAGDLLVAFETVAREAEREGKAFADHLRHLIVHGFLHLLGFDHVDDANACAMETVEIAVLAGFGIADPYGEPLEAQRPAFSPARADPKERR